MMIFPYQIKNLFISKCGLKLNIGKKKQLLFWTKNLQNLILFFTISLHNFCLKLSHFCIEVNLFCYFYFFDF